MKLQTKEDTIGKLNQELTQKDGDLKLLREKGKEMNYISVCVFDDSIDFSC